MSNQIILIYKLCDKHFYHLFKHYYFSPEQGRYPPDSENYTPEKKRRFFSEEKKQEIMKYAISMGTNKASTVYKIGRSTIVHWLNSSDLCPKGGLKLGRPLSYPKELEERLRDVVLEKLAAGEEVWPDDLKSLGTVGANGG